MNDLREALVAAGYHEEGVADLLGESPGLGAANAEVYRRRLGRDRAATLVRLFRLGDDVSEGEALQALSPLDLDALVGAGLLERGGGRVRPRAQIAPWRGLHLVSDLDSARGEAEFVGGATPSAELLARLTIRRQAASMLDLGTGSGAHALLAAAHSREVVGVDVNARALRYAELNARLNGVENAAFLEGSWFEPVAGREFDLVVANPPYVISPDAELVYRDSDLPGDEVTRRVLAELPRHLRDGGFASMQCNWAHGATDDWREPLEHALAGSGCDVLLLKYRTYDPVGYAADWIPLPAAVEPRAVGAELDRWLAYFSEAGIERISWGTVVLRRRARGRNFVRALELERGPRHDAGEHLLRLFTGRDYLATGPSDEAVLDTVFSLPQGLRFEERTGPAGEARVRVVLRESVGLATKIDAEAARVLARCEGRARLRDLGASPATAEAARRLVELGLLETPPR